LQQLDSSLRKLIVSSLPEFSKFKHVQSSACILLRIDDRRWHIPFPAMPIFVFAAFLWQIFPDDVKRLIAAIKDTLEEEGIIPAEALIEGQGD